MFSFEYFIVLKKYCYVFYPFNLFWCALLLIYFSSHILFIYYVLCHAYFCLFVIIFCNFVYFSSIVISLYFLL